MTLSDTVSRLVGMQEHAERLLRSAKDKAARGNAKWTFLAQQHALDIQALDVAIRALVELPEVK